MSLIERRGLLLGLGAGLAMMATPALAGATPENRGIGAISAIQIRKAARKLELIDSTRKIIRQYDVRLGSNPVGPKRYQGDGRTPEGVYRIDARNRKSAFHLALGVSYPAASDRARAARLGRSPGGDIFIHGQPNGSRGTYPHDWTRGCIALSDADMTEIFGLIPLGLAIRIYP